jgi:hypothetical protein
VAIPSRMSRQSQPSSNRSRTMVDSMRGDGMRLVTMAQSTTDPDLGYFPRSESWSRLGESNPGPAHYELCGSLSVAVPHRR